MSDSICPILGNFRFGWSPPPCPTVARNFPLGRFRGGSLEPGRAISCGSSLSRCSTGGKLLQDSVRIETLRSTEILKDKLSGLCPWIDPCKGESGRSTIVDRPGWSRLITGLDAKPGVRTCLGRALGTLFGPLQSSWIELDWIVEPNRWSCAATVRLVPIMTPWEPLEQPDADIFVWGLSLDESFVVL